MRCLRAILGVNKLERITNITIRKILNVQNISEVIRMRRLKWFGHISRRPDDSFVKTVLIQDFQGNRGRGRPPLRWQDQVRKDTGIPIATAIRQAQNRKKWSATVKGAKGHPA